MSRIGRKPISLPPGVEVTVVDQTVTVKGPKGILNQTIPPSITLVKEENQLLVQRPSDQKQDRAFHGLSRALIANMVEGVTNGFQKK